MKISSKLMIGLAFAAFGCGDEGDSTEADANAGATDVDVSANITADTTWKAGTTYHLEQKAAGGEGGPYIFVKAPATLTIEAGVEVLGAEGTALVIGRGAKIQAVGTADKPIVFSHDAAAGSRESGKWGGLVILGAAPHNIVTGENTPFEAFNQLGGIGNFGGSNAADDSGTLKYVRIEFAGFSYTTDREFNGLTLCGVGSGTTIDYVQVHRGSDDGIELFGGTVNLRHVVISQNQDDGLDTDNGYAGKVQFLVIQDIQGATSDGSHGFESDNHAAPDTNFNNQPRTAPTVYNATVIGNKATTVPHFGAVLRRGTSGVYSNIIFTNFKSAVVEVRDAATALQVTEGKLSISSSVFFDNVANFTSQAMNDVLDESATWAAANGNSTTTDPQLPAGMTSASAPSFKPMAALSGGATPPNDGFFDVSATYIGAVGATDWTTGWTQYPDR